MMRVAAVVALLACGATLAAERASWHFNFQPFSGRYAIYGGGLGDPVAPSERSKMVAFSVSGQVAKQMFEAMGPDLVGVCGAENGTRMRQRAELLCSYDPKDGYECSFGFDLISGRSIGGKIC
jgi:hypothetical protein